MRRERCVRWEVAGPPGPCSLRSRAQRPGLLQVSKRYTIWSLPDRVQRVMINANAPVKRLEYARGIREIAKVQIEAEVCAEGRQSAAAPRRNREQKLGDATNVGNQRRLFQRGAQERHSA